MESDLFIFALSKLGLVASWLCLQSLYTTSPYVYKGRVVTWTFGIFFLCVPFLLFGIYYGNLLVFNVIVVFFLSVSKLSVETFVQKTCCCRSDGLS